MRSMSVVFAALALWQARHLNNTVTVNGTLLLGRDATGWYAEANGERAHALAAGNNLSFKLPACGCGFETHVPHGASSLFGHWFQAPTMDSGLSYASPVTLRRTSENTYAGKIDPLFDPLTFYLAADDPTAATTSAFLMNPERDLGNLWNVNGLRTTNGGVELLGGSSKNEVIASGSKRPDGTLSMYFDERGGTYDFARIPAGTPTDFYPRGMPSVPYSYLPPPALHDGWRVGDVESVGISKAAIEKFVQFLIDTPMDSAKSRQIHALLIARHGKLVVEEYFHGMNRDRPHDPRSASKSITSALFGAAMEAGFPVSPSTPVYKAMNGGKFPNGLDALKRKMTVDSLLTMSSGWDCDDADDSSPGNENNISDNLHVADWYSYTLALKVIRPPGTQAVYCSIQPNIVGGVLTRVTHRSIPDLFHDLIAVPMQIKRYYIDIRPNGDAFMGGGLRLLARDYMKFPQLYLNGGTWNGKRVVSSRWVRRSTAARVRLKYYRDPMYGYLWWIKDFEYAGHRYRAFSMLGAGGQTFTAIPQLDLVVGFEAGDYMHRLPSVFTTYIPQYIFPAIRQ